MKLREENEEDSEDENEDLHQERLAHNEGMMEYWGTEGVLEYLEQQVDFSFFGSVMKLRDEAARQRNQNER